MPPRRRNSRSATPVVDKISTLPDDILRRILSFLTTKEAVSTTILSKRWTHLCHHLPNLRFTNIKLNSVQSIPRFNQSVYSVLLSRQIAGSNSIKEFHLHIQFGNPNHGHIHGFPHVMKWIKLFVQRGLEHLHLDIGNDVYTKFPISLFTCTTLVSLNLSGFYIKFSSNGFQFPSLKTLNLVSVTFSEVKDFVLLIAGCPILEDLDVLDLTCNHEDSLTIQEYKSLSFPRLTRARIREIYCSFPAKAFTNSEFLSTDAIIYSDNELNRLKLPCDDIYIFHNLTHLEIQDSWGWMLQLLQLCPKLQNLKLGQKYNAAMWDEDDDVSYVEPEPEFVPQCLLSYFRTCTIEDFLGRKYEIQLAEYILRNAMNLQTMTIQCYWGMPKLEKDWSQCPKASATCELSVYIE